MNTKLLKTVCLLTGAFMLSGCATRVALKREFWDQKSGKIGIAIVQPPAAKKVADGGGGLIGYALAAAGDRDINAFLSENIRFEEFNDCAEIFAKKLSEKGFTVKCIKEFVSLEKLPKVEPARSGCFKYDISKYAQEEGVDQLLLLQITEAGILKQQIVLDIGSSSTYCAATGQLIDATSNRLLWAETVRRNAALISLTGDWNNPPEYPVVKKQIPESVQKATELLRDSFFGNPAL